MAENYSEHVSNLRRLAVTLQGVIAAADAMEKIGSIENHIAEAERARIDALNRKHRAEEEFESTKNALARNHAAAESVLKDAEAKAIQTLKQADHEAQTAISDGKRVAEQEAERITKEKSIELDRLLDEIERKRGVIFQLKTETQAAQKERDRAEEARASAQISLDAVLGQIAALPGRR